MSDQLFKGGAFKIGLWLKGAETCGHCHLLGDLCLVHGLEAREALAEALFGWLR
jgi:hypothetical protein